MHVLNALFVFVVAEHLLRREITRGGPRGLPPSEPNTGYSGRRTVLGGALAVPCTRNPL